jgi:RNA polymerase sigma-70 factor (ECF subfamily)
VPPIALMALVAGFFAPGQSFLNLLTVLVGMSAITETALGELAEDADTALRQLYARYAHPLRKYVERFGPDLASADDIVQETFIRAWRHLPQLAADDQLVRPWLFRVARNLLIDAARGARSRPVTVEARPDLDLRDEDQFDQLMDRQLVAEALQRLSPAHRMVLVETFYRGGTTAMVARQLGIPHGTARSRLHYALDALRAQLQDPPRSGSHRDLARNEARHYPGRPEPGQAAA